MKRPFLIASVVASLLALAGPAWGLVHGFDGQDGNQACVAEIDWSCLPTDWDLSTAADGTGSADVVFASSSKEELPNEWDFQTGGPGDKTDILNVWSAWREPGDDSYLFLAFNRSGGEGNAFFSFELNQKEVAWTNQVGETIPCRSDDDVLVSYEIPSTTSQPVALKLYRWQGSGGPATCVDGATGAWVAAPTAASGTEGAINNGQIPSTLTGGTLADATFGEAALDLSAVAQAVGITAPCEYFTRLQAHSRSSSSFSSSMGDYVASGDVSVAACKQDPGGGDPPALPTISADTGCHIDGDVTLSGTTDPGTYVRVRDSGGSVGIAHDSDSDGDWSLTVEDVADGETFTAQAYDADNNASAITAATGPVTVDTVAPAAPTITSPAAGAEVTAGNVTISGTAQPNSTVAITEDGAPVTSTTADGSGAWSVTVAVAAGEHDLDVDATDACATGATTRLSFTATTSGDPDPDPDGDGDPDANPTGTSGNDGGGGATVTKPAPQIQVLGEVQCSSKKFTLAVPGKGLKRVVFKVDGRKVKTDKSKNGKGAFTLAINPKKFSSGKHRVTATLVPRKGKARTVPLRSFERCERGKCVSRRAFKIRVKKAKGEEIVSAKVFVNGKRVKVVKGARLRSAVKLTGLPKGRFKVRIQALTKSGKTITDVRKYRTCTKKTKKPAKKKNS